MRIFVVDNFIQPIKENQGKLLMQPKREKKAHFLIMRNVYICSVSQWDREARWVQVYNHGMNGSPVQPGSPVPPGPFPVQPGSPGNPPWAAPGPGAMGHIAARQ